MGCNGQVERREKADTHDGKSQNLLVGYRIS